MVRGWRLAFVLLALALPRDADAAGWQDAVRQLRQVRTLAENCAAVIRQFGDAGEKARGAVAYGEAKADYGGVIAGLIVALAGQQAPTCRVMERESISASSLMERNPRASMCFIVRPVSIHPRTA